MITGTSWRKASASSGNGGACVEVGQHAMSLLIRDTTDRDSGSLRFSPEAFRAFTARLRTQ